MADLPLIHNPASARGKGAARAREAQRALAERGIDARLVATSAPGDAIDIAARLAREGAPRILAMGGDGTVSEAADGVLRSGRSVELGLLPGGTGNDLLAHFGVRTLDDAVARIAAGKARAMDAMRIRWPGGERHAIGAFGLGFAARVADTANRRFKALGARGYTAAVFPVLARLRAPGTRILLDGGERVIDEPLVLVTVANTRFVGGGMDLAPMAVPDDGLLEIVALRKVGRVGLLRIFPKIFSGAHVGHPRVIVERARRVRIETDDAGPLLGDGEIYGHAPVDVDALPGALRVLL